MWQARRGHAEGREALSELNERLEAQRRQHDDATRVAQEGEAAAAQSTKAVLDAARQRAEAAEAQAEVEVEAARREARGARAEQAIAQEQAAEAQAALREGRAGQQRSDEERDAAAGARHAEAVDTLQVQRDEAHERLRGEERRAVQLEADLAGARAELTRAAAAREDADAREATLLGVQEQMAAQLGEVRMRAASGGGPLSTPGGMGFDEELPSPVSIPSLPISPMPSKWGAATSSHAPPTAHNLSGLSGGLSDTARARRGALEAENGALRAEVASLEAQALKMREAVSAMRREMEQTRGGDGASASGGSAALVSQLQARLTQLTQQLADRTREAEEARVRSEGGGLLTQLQSKLATAEADVARLMVEREKLMEMSNMLRADLHRATANALLPAADGGAGAGAAEVRARAEREVASRYETKLGEIEASMRELVAQNAALKVELRKWTEHTEAEVERRSTIRRPARPMEHGGPPSSAQYGGPPSTEARSGFSRRAVDFAEEEAALLTRAEQHAASAAAAGEDDVGRGLSRRAGLALSPEDDARWLHDSGGGSGGDDEDAAARWAAPRGAEADPARHRARAKLEEAKLSLAGSSAAISERQPRHERGTSSQTKARLMEIQKKRSELMRKRQGVRNYNDTDD